MKEEPIAFDTTQITHPENRSKPEAGDPCHPLAAQGHPPAIAFSCKDHGADAGEEASPTLRAMGHTDSHANGGGQVAIAHPIYGVRRLTPKECERLQAWPDGWTAKRAKLKLDGNLWVATGATEAQTDSPRYKQAGNGVTSSVPEWIAQRINPLLTR